MIKRKIAISYILFTKTISKIVTNTEIQSQAFIYKIRWGWAKRKLKDLATYRVIIVCLLANKFQGGGDKPLASVGDTFRATVILIKLTTIISSLIFLERMASSRSAIAPRLLVDDVCNKYIKSCPFHLFSEFVDPSLTMFETGNSFAVAHLS